MSDVMLFGVLRMPYEMAMGSELSRWQFYTRAQEAVDRLEAAERGASPGRCKACGRATLAVCDGLDGNGLGCTNAPPIDIAATQEGEG